ncbi:MAG: PspA/IM30 family protein [Myxococcales bacterium]|nr:PspA/IM30 family protein [Myxococcales bacterium]
MSDRPRGIIGRLRGLFRGLFTSWLRDRENRNPSAIYEEAIQERTRQYRDLKQAVAGILYMRNKLEAEISERRAEIARTHDDISRAVRRSDDELSLALIVHKDGLLSDLERAEKELDQVRGEVETAKTNLVQFRSEIKKLEREKLQVIATLANARARRRFQEALEGLSLDGEMRALEQVREYIGRVRVESHLEREFDDDGLDRRIREIREEARSDAARRELAELKRRLGPKVLPAVDLAPAP